MKSRSAVSQRKTILKVALIAETIICYMAVLTVISYARGPERYQTVTAVPLLRSEDFVSFAGVSVETDFLDMENPVPGEAVGYQTDVQLADIDELSVSFRIDCPEEYAGGILYTDLYNYEAGYDDPAQEYQMTLQTGLNEADFSLNPGQTSPETAKLRIFTLDGAGYQLKDIQIFRKQLLPKVSKSLLAGMCVCFLLLAGTGLIWVQTVKQGKGEEA